jgi:hypothetical protein
VSQNNIIGHSPVFSVKILLKSDACNDFHDWYFSGHIGDMYIVIVLRKVNHIMTHLKPRKLFSLVLNNHILSFLLFIYRQKKNNINTFHIKLLHDSNTKALHKKRKIQIKKSENLTVWRLKCYNLLHVSIARKYFT